jgi:hypothetical protein
LPGATTQKNSKRPRTLIAATMPPSRGGTGGAAAPAAPAAPARAASFPAAASAGPWPLSLNVLSTHYIGVDVVPPPAGHLEAALRYAAGHQFGAVDLEDRLFESTAADYLDSIVALAAELGLALNSIGVKVDFAIAPTQATVEEEVRRASSWLAVAAQMGVPFLRLPGCGCPAGTQKATALELMRQKFRHVVAAAEGTGVTVLLHNHNHGAVPSTSVSFLHAACQQLPRLSITVAICSISPCVSLPSSHNQFGFDLLPTDTHAWRGV